MAKRKLPTVREYIKEKFAPPADTSPEQASALFHATIKASVKNIVKPKTKAKK